MAEIVKFDKGVLDALKTYKSYERRYKEYKKAQETWVRTREGELGPGYSAWMCGRRMGDYRYFLEVQEAEIHEEAIGGTYLICTCGLAIDGKFDEPELARTLGHINVGSREVVTVFIFENDLICQGCGKLGKIDRDLESEACAALVKEARLTHKCNLEITDELRERVAELLANAK